MTHFSNLRAYAARLPREPGPGPLWQSANGEISGRFAGLF